MTVYVSRHASTDGPGPTVQPRITATGRAKVSQPEPILLTFVWQRMLSQPAQAGGRR
ncbi:multiple cyclophane-containing RiPP AmcA [Micromonospora sp. KC207]|uniref:multiple cyclophane-containing RiPP AmcA n=1 Tax=Micromonospora sp. KC207 TaxID=2530377 RepID=UPI0026AE67D0|nr:multiple cyclophane-containing RiPP AmcA [Micromonospora sp. KC207]